MGSLIFVTGGARSGKSRFAEGRASQAGRAVVYLATMQPLDAEMVDRIARHVDRRPAAWTTVEEPIAIADAIDRADPSACILLDCLSLWVSNRLLAATPDPDAAPPAALAAAADACVAESAGVIARIGARPGTTIVVSNEVGSGIVPLGALSRAYRDGLGLVNQAFAVASDEAYALLSGLPLRLK